MERSTSTAALVPGLLLLMASCASGMENDFDRAALADDDSASDSSPDQVDADGDGDGYAQSIDCDDDNATVWPGAPELCDKIDNDCDLEIDEEPLANLSWYPDADGDGYGVSEGAVQDCAPPEGYCGRPGDCDDEAPAIHPGARIDGIDSDCDGRIEWKLSITISAVESYRLCLDDEDNVLGSDSNWRYAETFEVWVDSGAHVVGFEGVGTDGEDEGLLTGAMASITTSAGPGWWTNGNWRHDPQPTREQGSRVGWCSPDFNSSEWLPAVDYGTWGVSPWGAYPPELEDTPASWIWDSTPTAAITQYFRLLITLP